MILLATRARKRSSTLYWRLKLRASNAASSHISGSICCKENLTCATQTCLCIIRGEIGGSSTGSNTTERPKTKNDDFFTGADQLPSFLVDDKEAAILAQTEHL
jgi:hypothetical protein